MTVTNPPITSLNNSFKLRNAAERLEAGYLSQMFKSAGLGEFQSEFSGGAGEEHFASFLRDEQAKAVVRAGGIGLSEHLYQALTKTAK